MRRKVGVHVLLDLSNNIQKNWPTIGKDLADKIHIYVGDMDNYYLNLAVYLLEDYLKTTVDPPARAEIQYGRPLKGHGWQPMTNADLIRMMAERINKTAPGLALTRGAVSPKSKILHKFWILEIRPP
jgi:hypothetical protein